MSKKLLTDWTLFEYTPDMVNESRERNNGKVMMKGILQKADTLNQNGRVYPLPVLEREVRNYQKFIKENRALGECDHPDSSVVELKNASHIIREAWMDGDICYEDITKPGRVRCYSGHIITWRWVNKEGR